MKLVTLPIMLSLFALCMLGVSASEATYSTPETYKNLRFWSEVTNNCYFNQVTSNSCIPASIQMALCYLDYFSVPNQTELAFEMQTDVNNTTQWKYSSIPFENRGFHNFLNHSLSDDFDVALSNLKTAVSENYPVIIDSWLSEKDKIDGNITHARVVTGYDLAGIFCHDPMTKPNEYLNNTLLSELWRTDLGYWALISKQEPVFNLNVHVTDWFGNPIPEVRLSLTGGVDLESVSDLNGVGVFQNLTLGTYTLICESQLQNENVEITVEKSESFELSLLSDQVIIFMVVAIAAILFAAALTIVFSKKH